MTGIVSELQKYVLQKYKSMHMPGHKSGAILPDAIKSAFGEKVFQYDLTELPETDNLQQPSGMILETEEKIADLHGAGASCLLVNGSTVGLLASIFALARSQEIFIASDCHQAVYNGVLLANASPIILDAGMDSATGHYQRMTPELLAEAIGKYPSCKTMVVTYPNYYGQFDYMKEIISLAAAHDIKVIVDEAHGAHGSYLDNYYPTAISCGADIVIQSWHKMLPVLNQGSVLLMKNKKWQTMIRDRINLFQTTSPSYLIMATMDAAASFCHEKKDEIQRTMKLIAKYKNRAKFDHLYMPGHEKKNDPFKLWIRSSKKIKSYAEEILRNKYRIEPEIISDYEILCIIPLICGSDLLEQLFKALTEIDAALVSESDTFRVPVWPIRDQIRKPQWKPSEVSLYPVLKIPLEAAAGRVSGQKIVAYPPGIPIVFPGEVLTQEIVCYLSDHKIHYNLQDGVLELQVNDEPGDY